MARYNGGRSLKIAIVLSLTACSAAGGDRTTSFLPPTDASLSDHAGRQTIALTLHIPSKGSADKVGYLSDLSESASISVDNAAAKVFAVAPKSPGCTSIVDGRSCTVHLTAEPAEHVFLLKTWSKAAGKGTLLNQTRFVVPVTTVASPIVIGPIVTTTADSGAGSLREALTNAAAAETIVFSTRAPAAIALNSVLQVARNVTIAGPGSSDLLVDGSDETQVVDVSAGVTATISGVTITKGSASNGGAIANAGALTLAGDVLSDNFGGSPNRAGLQESSASRAVLRDVGHFDPRPLKGARIPRPPTAPALERPQTTSAGLGGAVYNTASLTVVASTFTKNSVQQGSGGAIYSAAGAKLIVTSSTFSGNTGASGGAINSEGGATLNSDTFAHNTGYPGGGAPITGGWGYGAAVYTDANLTVTNCAFNGNIAGGDTSQSYGAGGAIAQLSGALAVTASTFSGNVAGGGSGGSWGRGGAIYNAGGTMTLKTSKFTGNKAGGDALGYGGGVFAVGAIGGGGNVFSANTAYGNGSGGFGYGGALYAQGHVTLEGDSFDSNDATGGSRKLPGYAFAGAADFENGSSLSKVTFTKNRTVGGLGGVAIGGAVFVNGGNSTWNSVTVSANRATASGSLSYSGGGGAAIYASLAMAGAQVSSNLATVSGTGSLGAVGGGFAVESGSFSYTGTVSDNTASTQGAGAWIDTNAIIRTSTFSSNRVAGVQNPNDGGGALYVALGASLQLTSSTLSGNSVGGSVTSTGGGALFNEGSSAVSNSTIAQNTSADDGGGIENESNGGLNLLNVTIFANSASSGSGGNLKNLFSDASMSIANSIIAQGVGANGADVSNDGTITSNDYNIVQTAPSGSPLTGATTHNLQADPQLLALKNNGGPTETQADQAASPGTAYIPDSICDADGITEDQRGDPRGVYKDGFCDVGAFEYQGAP